MTSWGELGSSAAHLHFTDGLGVRTLTFCNVHAICQTVLTTTSCIATISAISAFRASAQIEALSWAGHAQSGQASGT